MNIMSQLVWSVALLISVGACAKENLPTATPLATPSPITATDEYDFASVDRLLDRDCPQLGGCALLLGRTP
jgi:hypothetical protein